MAEPALVWFPATFKAVKPGGELDERNNGSDHGKLKGQPVS